ncbi:transposase [uncultured Psychrosphaera sp.]|uniref:transposase n=1 Tax=uncultured Psychrosphaera sp. TaxID=1403522 RepID=UPI00261CD59B|nr:transposase [uncultured Psychrosphaera sp.]
MPRPREFQISLADTPYYHCISRCVRRAFLCGEDKQTHQSYEHRRQWVEDKIEQLPQVFAIEVCAYAVMSNHTHLVLHINEQQALSWDTTEVLTRWHRLFKGTLLTQKYLSKINGSPDLNSKLLNESKPLTGSELLAIEEITVIYRKRLMDISWFMRVLNEGIARQANKEDSCTGRFWEGRFKCQALLDDSALLACMAYVDLNPVRANIAKTPETSEYTSIKQRIHHALYQTQPKSLKPFVGNLKKDMLDVIPFELKEYIELVEVTGRCVREEKAGHIDNNLPTLLRRLNIEPDNWLVMTKQFTTVFHGAVGNEHVLQNFVEHKQLKRRPNLSICRRLLA